MEAHVTIHQKSLHHRKDGTSKNVWHRLPLMAYEKSSQKSAWILEKIPTQIVKPMFWGPDMVNKWENGKMVNVHVIHALYVSSHLGFIAMPMWTMMIVTWEEVGEVMCKTGVHSSLLLRETGRASASFCSLYSFPPRDCKCFSILDSSNGTFPKLTSFLRCLSRQK